jgi:hypothetical protein
VVNEDAMTRVFEHLEVAGGVAGRSRAAGAVVPRWPPTLFPGSFDAPAGFGRG